MVTITRKHVLTLLAASLAAVAFLVAAASSAPRAAGTLNLHGSLATVGHDAVCPAGLSVLTLCHSRSARGGISGLGKVTHTYMYNADPTLCPFNYVRILGYTTSFTVGGKGEIDFSVTDAPTCLLADPSLPSPPALNATQSFTVTGGTGIYAGASGSGRIERAGDFTSGGAAGKDTWLGTVVVPGLEFDVTPPTLTGATSKTVQAPRGAKRVRVKFTVTASDNVDSQVPVTCKPPSGGRFRIGSTIVKCSATDSSANTANASFRVTVRPAR